MVTQASSEGGGVKLKKELALLDGVSIIVGIIVGAGIFVSPKGVLIYSGSVGLSLIIWTLCGVLCIIGALCYAELGTFIPKSGGDYAYINEGFGPLFAFLYLWVALFIMMPTGNAIAALTFAQYILKPFTPDCDLDSNAVRSMAAAVVCLLTFVNCYNVKWTNKLQVIFTAAKVVALGIIIATGLYILFSGQGKSDNFTSAFKNTTTNPSLIAIALYQGLFSYSGWNYLNFVTEELKNPYKNLPRAIIISLLSVITIYVLTNVAYFAVLDPMEMINSDAVAVTFGEKTLAAFSWIMPLSVAMSTFGGLNGGIYTSSRLFFVGAREGHLPSSLATINIFYSTPAPSLIFLGIVTLVYLCTTQIYMLIEYTQFVESVFFMMSIGALLKLRWDYPNVERPIKVHIALPILFLIICLFLVILPIYGKPYQTCVALGLLLLGVPVYFLTIYWRNKPRWLYSTIAYTNIGIQKLLMSVPEEVDDETDEPAPAVES